MGKSVTSLNNPMASHKGQYLGPRYELSRSDLSVVLFTSTVYLIGAIMAGRSVILQQALR